MNIKKLKSIVKYNKFFLFVYRIFGNFFISILKIFVKVNDKQIIFMSFGGQKFDDSPKALYDRIINDSFFNDYALVWAFSNPDLYNVDCRKVKTDTIKFYLTVLSAKYWIHNSSMERGLCLKRPKNIEINTWHGTPLKKMGCDISNYKGYSAKYKEVGTVVYCAQSEFDKDVWIRLFSTSPNNIIISDLPRNDYLKRFPSIQIEAIKSKLNIPFEKKVILYAPTFREYDRDKSNACFINPPIDLNKWKKTLGKEYILLFRAHYEVVKFLGINTDEFCFNVSNYDNLNELMIVSDILISDYSSIFFDYSILGRPMLCFAYDLEQYRKNRGLYENIFDKLPCKKLQNEDEVLSEIISLDYEEQSLKTKKFSEDFAPCAGMASSIIIDYLKTLISKKV